VLGDLIFSGELIALNRYTGTTFLQGWLYGAEELLLTQLR
jgi:hypothetical protein